MHPSAPISTDSFHSGRVGAGVCAPVEVAKCAHTAIMSESSFSTSRPPTLEHARLAGLRDTWEYARRHSRYYARLLPQIKRDELRLTDLSRLPLCTKDDITAHRDELRCGQSLPDYMVFTGGTSGAPEVIYGTKEEIEYYRRSSLSGTPREPRSLRLITDGGHHGFIPQVPGMDGCIQVPLRNRKNFVWAWHMLSSEHSFQGYEPKVSYVMLPLSAVKKFLHFCLEQDYDLSQLALKAVGTFAWFLSSSWKHFIENMLNCTVVNFYGFTEIRAALAQECLACGFLHYGKQVIWEIIDPWSLAPIQNGIGRLTVTSLYPYTQDLILFRYQPGDLVEAGPFCELAMDRGFRFCGRDSQACTINDGVKNVIAVLPTTIQSFIDFNPMIARFEERRFSGVTLSNDDSFPKWRMRKLEHDSIPKIKIELELKLSPALFAVEWTTLRMNLRSHLLDSNVELRRLVEQGRVVLEIEGLPMGTLQDSEVFIC